MNLATSYRNKRNGSGVLYSRALKSIYVSKYANF